MLKSIKKVLEPILGYGIVVIFLIAIIAVFALFGGAIMRIFGFQYDSVMSIIIFFVVVTVIGFPAETLSLALPRALLSLNKITIRTAKIVFVILDALSTAITMAVVDYFMESVSAKDIAILVISILIALISMRDVDQLENSQK